MEEECSIAFNLENNRKNSEIDIDTEGAGDILELTNKCNASFDHRRPQYTYSGIRNQI